VSTVTASGHYCHKTKHDVSHSHLNYTRCLLFELSQAAGHANYLLSRSKLTDFHWDSVATFNPALMADREEGVGEREREREGGATGEN